MQFSFGTVLGALASVAVIFVLVGLGVFVQRMHWFPGDSWKSLSRLVVNLCVPCAIFMGLTDGFDRAALLGFLGGAAISGATILLSALACMPLSRLLRVPRNRRGVFLTICAFTNTVFIGVPMTQMLFGQDAVRYAYIAFLANSVLFWTLGAFLIRSDAQGNAPFFAPGWWIKLISPGMIALISALAFILLGWKPPYIAAQSMRLLSNMVSPLALIYCGMQIGALCWKALKLDGSFAAMGVMRFVISPAICIGLCLAFAPRGSDPLMLRVLVAQAAMPAMAQISIIAGLYGADAEYASTGFLITTVLSMVFTPLVMLAISMAF